MRRKPKHLIRGKSIREWSETLNVKFVTAWSWFRKGTLEAHIDGTHQPKRPRRYFGLTVREIQKRLSVKSRTVYHYIDNGTLERRLKGEAITGRYPLGEIICAGKTARQIQAQLGISKQRVYQLKNKGLLEDHLRGIDTYKRMKANIRKKTAAQRKLYRQLRRPGESPLQLARRLGVTYAKVKPAFPGKVPFAKERHAPRQ